MIAVGRREGYRCRLRRRNGDSDGDDDESESLFKSYTNVVPLGNPTLDLKSNPLPLPEQCARQIPFN